MMLTSSSMPAIFVPIRFDKDPSTNVGTEIETKIHSGLQRADVDIGEPGRISDEPDRSARRQACGQWFRFGLPVVGSHRMTPSCTVQVSGAPFTFTQFDRSLPLNNSTHASSSAAGTGHAKTNSANPAQHLMA
jgi:hypothetical protein